MDTTVLDVDTAREQVVDLTDQVRDFCRTRGDGLVNVFAPHATAGIAIIETGARSDDDLVGADHVLPAIVAPSVVLPVHDGEPLLGVWQSVVLVDLNRDNPRRQVRLSFVAG
jgi:thiamine phosphate synthase YjbQ (UPF0047 family)